jgi:peptide/nickel transport system substrate-binding protein
MTEKAIKTSVTDLGVVNQQWAAIDKATTDQAPWISLFLPRHVDFLSSRVGNYIFDPNVLVGGPLLDQLWVK